MPIYCYKCPNCERVEEVSKPMSESDSEQECTRCFYMMERDVTAESGGAVVGSELARPFWSESLAISPGQAAEHKVKFPDVLVDREGRVGFTSHKQREKYLETCGFQKKVAKLK